MMTARRSLGVLIAALVGALAVGFVGLLFGTRAMGVGQALAALVGNGTRLDGVIVWTLRMPRSLAAFFGGAGLAVSGYLLQSVTRNPLAAPDLTGVIAGAVAAIVTCFVFLPWISTLSYPFVGLAGGLAAGAATFWISRGGQTSPLHLALGGVTVSLFLSAIVTYVLLQGGPQSPALLFWLSGGFQGRSWFQLGTMLPWVVIGVAGALASHRVLEVLALGDASAAAMGLRLDLWKPVLLVLAVCPVAGITPVAGPVAFVGLAVPHIVRLLRPWSTGWAILLNVAIGGLLVVLADVLARSLAAPREIPIGIVTALIGGPFFIHLVQRRNIASGALS